MDDVNHSGDETFIAYIYLPIVNFGTPHYYTSDWSLDITMYHRNKYAAYHVIVSELQTYINTLSFHVVVDK